MRLSKLLSALELYESPRRLVASSTHFDGEYNKELAVDSRQWRKRVSSAGAYGAGRFGSPNIAAILHAVPANAGDGFVGSRKRDCERWARGRNSQYAATGS